MLLNDRSRRAVWWVFAPELVALSACATLVMVHLATFQSPGINSYLLSLRWFWLAWGHLILLLVSIASGCWFGVERGRALRWSGGLLGLIYRMMVGIVVLATHLYASIMIFGLTITFLTPGRF